MVLFEVFLEKLAVAVLSGRLFWNLIISLKHLIYLVLVQVTIFYLEAATMYSNSSEAKFFFQLLGNMFFCMIYFFRHCPLFQNERSTLLSIAKNIDNKLLDHSDLHLTQVLLFDDANTNTSILNPTIDSVVSSQRFGKLLFWTANFLYSTAALFLILDLC